MINTNALGGKEGKLWFAFNTAHPKDSPKRSGAEKRQENVKRCGVPLCKSCAERTPTYTAITSIARLLPALLVARLRS